MGMQIKDSQLIWHPFQGPKSGLPIGIVKGKGAYLYGEDKKKYLDLISSWWVNLHGHAHPKIAEAIYKQASILEHVIFAGFTHFPAVNLCEKLSMILPSKLSRFFFSDNGSTAVEVALKMAYQYWQNLSEYKRTRFLSFEGGYHGDTFGAMAVGKTSGFHNNFQKLFFEVDTIPFPSTWIGDEEIDKKEKASLKALNEYLEKNGSFCACFIAEPLLQGARGMRMCRSSFLQKVIALLRSYGIIIIFDEILTGFGRTGSTFAFEQVKEVPDIICLAKGLSGGFLPIALTVVSQSIFKAFCGTKFEKTFAHGHSYTANPLGCAAAAASLEILLEKKTQDNIQALAKVQRENIANLNVVAPRFLGTIAAFNLESTRTIYSHKIAAKLKKLFLQEGLLLRPLGNTVYLMPPYCLKPKLLKESYQKIAVILSKL
ncbi:MAG: adenosylmethionine--8-amino-7-oxononanoate transaminase [Chlamydiae bacterium]|nr:adenosylmethionine--8-amino-7-oxononanoate transaminase [Chlamydiota bacterium]